MTLRKAVKKKGSKYDYIPFKKLQNTKAWKTISFIVRKQSKGICYTCGKRIPFKKLHAGHLIEKLGAAAIYFDTRGIRAQCYRCNRPLHGNKDIFGYKLRKEIGEEEVQDLYRKAGKSKKWTREETDTIAGEHENAYKELSTGGA